MMDQQNSVLSADNQQLKEMLDAEKQEFLAVMSHELRTPMTGVKGYLSMVLDGDAGPISDEIKDYLSEAYLANDRLIRLVDNLMKVVNVQEGRISLNIQKVDLVKNIQLIVNDSQERAKSKNLSLVYNKPDEEIFVMADADKLREVILHLVTNAIKFTNSGEININHRFINDHLAVVDVMDTGVGIKQEHQSRIFEIFSKANLGLASQEKGTGVGLFLACKLAEAQDGKVWLEKSKEGEGSTFSAAFQIAK